MHRVLALFLLLIIPSFGISQNNIGPGNALDFDGVNDCVDLGQANNNLTYPVTVMAWVKPAVRTSTTATLFASNTHSTNTNYHGIIMSIRSNRLAIGFGNGVGGFTGSGRRGYAFLTSGLDSEWIHVTGVIYTPNSMKLYINGIEVNGSYTGTATYPISTPSTGSSYVGYSKKTAGYYNDGEVDEFRVWSRALGATEVRENMCRKVDPTSSNLVHAYDFNESQSAASLANSVSTATASKLGGITTTQSEAPVGDASTFDVGTYSNSSRTLVIGPDSVRVDQLSSMAKGVQFYKIYGDTIPTASCVDTTVFGVFLMETNLNSNSNFQKNNSVGSTPAYVRNNAANNWTAYASNTYTLRKEWINQSQMGPFNLLGQDTVLCTGDSLLLTLPLNYSCTWGDGSTANSNYLYPGQTLWVQAMDGLCSSQDTITAAAESLLPVYPLHDTTICIGDDLAIVLPTIHNNVVWSNQSTGNSVQFTLPGTHWYSSSNMCGSIGDTFNLSVIDCDTTGGGGDTTGGIGVDSANIWLPNAFTPNGDNVNDHFTIYGLSGFQIELIIYNRWGGIVYRTTDNNAHWDGYINGSEAAEGAYVYVLKITDFRGKERHYHGMLHLFR